MNHESQKAFLPQNQFQQDTFIGGNRKNPMLIRHPNAGEFGFPGKVLSVQKQ
jgi:hypothetical protein